MPGPHGDGTLLQTIVTVLRDAHDIYTVTTPPRLIISSFVHHFARKCTPIGYIPTSVTLLSSRLMEEEHEQIEDIAAEPANKPTISGSSSHFHNWTYAPGGFDVMGILVRVARRPNPQIDLGPIDCEAAVIVCDTFEPDTPIVYCSEAFSLLTGYSESEILGRNCRFLQSPSGSDEIRDPPLSQKGNFSPLGDKGDQQKELLRMKDSVHKREEVQVMVGNYTREGTPFANLVSVIPVRWNEDDKEKRYLVGFQNCMAKMRRTTSE
ncbi:unnamed protein product [Zymoseptoria tritici ST99CH_1E4]|nr:unnamed protein product [Zymoseptoria tritici ST99CH_1E4]